MSVVRSPLFGSAVVHQQANAERTKESTENKNTVAISDNDRKISTEEKNGEKRTRKCGCDSGKWVNVERDVAEGAWELEWKEPTPT